MTPECAQEYSRLNDDRKVLNICGCSTQCLLRRSTAAAASVLVLLMVTAALSAELAVGGQRMRGVLERFGFVRRMAGAPDLAVTEDCEVNVILARHCNKRPPWDPDPTPQELCTEEGLLRGENMARLFAEEGPFPVPSRLYARQMPQGVYSSRDLYLLWPLAQRYGLIVNATFSAEHVLELAATILSDRPALCAQTILISWDHCAIPALAQALGCTHDGCKQCWDDRDYDTLLWLRYNPLEGGDWKVHMQIGHEGYGGFDGASGYRECIGNPVENRHFGYSCQSPESWVS